MRADGAAGESVSVPMQHPLSAYFTATVRGGSASSTCSATVPVLPRRSVTPECGFGSVAQF